MKITSLTLHLTPYTVFDTPLDQNRERGLTALGRNRQQEGYIVLIYVNSVFFQVYFIEDD